MNTKRIYTQKGEVLDFTFSQNRYDFIVDEIPLGEFSNRGNFLVLKIKKIFISTWDLLSIISEKLDIDEHQIGYSGLKDKNATTTQYISIPLNKSRDFKLLNSKYIEVLDTFRHHEKLKIGNLKGNKFKITLKDINPDNLMTLYNRISKIQKHGVPNYFGFQRFGKDEKFDKTRAIVYGEEIIKDKKLEKFMKFTYQSYFFNAWLAKRVELSNEQSLNKLLVLKGDIFEDKSKKVITGLLPGRNVVRAKDEAGEIEKEFDDIFIHEKGLRRAAWVYPQNIKNKYIKEKNWMELEFSLPKSSYATVVIEAIANKNFGH
ncbi:MAG: tRNA pseudouridine(13) synthase TruD [Campylobacterota bacterium]|nr:tRNA pseudouridine(13) synthase TruD [Campylobacterota bacterium]